MRWVAADHHVNDYRWVGMTLSGYEIGRHGQGDYAPIRVSMENHDFCVLSGLEFTGISSGTDGAATCSVSWLGGQRWRRSAKRRAGVQGVRCFTTCFDLEEKRQLLDVATFTLSSDQSHKYVSRYIDKKYTYCALSHVEIRGHGNDWHDISNIELVRVHADSQYQLTVYVGDAVKFVQASIMCFAQ